MMAQNGSRRRPNPSSPQSRALLQRSTACPPTPGPQQPFDCLALPIGVKYQSPPIATPHSHRSHPIGPVRHGQDAPRQETHPGPKTRADYLLLLPSSPRLPGSLARSPQRLQRVASSYRTNPAATLQPPLHCTFAQHGSLCGGWDMCSALSHSLIPSSFFLKIQPGTKPPIVHLSRLPKTSADPKTMSLGLWCHPSPFLLSHPLG